MSLFSIWCECFLKQIWCWCFLLQAGNVNEELIEPLQAKRAQASHAPGSYYPVDFRLPLPAEAANAPDMRLLVGTNFI